jgi:hypothetical protein
MRIVVLGAGVIGTVYAGGQARAGHQIGVMARGRRAEELRGAGLIPENAETWRRTVFPVQGASLDDTAWVLVLVAVQRDQFVGALGPRLLFGLPAAGGVRDGAVVRYVAARTASLPIIPRTAQLRVVPTARWPWTGRGASSGRARPEGTSAA